MEQVNEVVVWDEAEELVKRLMDELNDYPDNDVREAARVILADRLDGEVAAA